MGFRGAETQARGTFQTAVQWHKGMAEGKWWAWAVYGLEEWLPVVAHQELAVAADVG